MSVRIVPITEHESYNLNGHIVFKNFLGNWTCKHNLSSQELIAFSKYEKVVINNPRFKKHTKATYNPKK